MSVADSGVGWFEFITDSATTHIAYVHEDGSVYLPEGREVVDESDFAFANARGRVWRLVRAAEDHSERPVTDAEAAAAEHAVRENFHAPDDTHPTWWINSVTAGRAVLEAARKARMQ